MDRSEPPFTRTLNANHSSVLDELAAAFRAIPQVEGLALGGSTATGQADAQSDIDLYVYCTEPVPTPVRLELAKARANRLEIANLFWEEGDEWDEAQTGIHVDVMYRDLAGTRTQLSRVLDQHEAALGYTTSLWHNVLTSRPLYDRSGKLGALKTAATRAYPHDLAKAIIAKNHPLIRNSFGAFAGQILKAAERADWVSLNHRTAALLASYFDIVFAANHAPHPGEKRLLTSAARLPHLPAAMSENLEKLLSSRTPTDLNEALDALSTNLDQLLLGLGFTLTRP